MATESPPKRFLLRSRNINTELDLRLVTKAFAPTSLIPLFGRLKCVKVLFNWSAFPSAVAPESKITAWCILTWVNVRFVSRNSANAWAPSSPIKTSHRFRCVKTQPDWENSASKVFVPTDCIQRVLSGLLDIRWTAKKTSLKVKCTSFFLEWKICSIVLNSNGSNVLSSIKSVRL